MKTLIEQRRCGGCLHCHVPTWEEIEVLGRTSRAMCRKGLGFVSWWQGCNQFEPADGSPPTTEGLFEPWEKDPQQEENDE